MDKKFLTYDEIRALSQEEAASIAIESMDIKGYDVYFINFGELRGYGYLVYKNGHQITDDTGVIHAHLLKEEGLAGLRRYYINALNAKLFTDDEIAEPLKSYEDYRQKSYFLHNYYAKQEDNISMFFIGSDKEREERKAKTDGMIFNSVGFCYMDKSLAAFVDKHVALLKKLIVQKANTTDNYEYQKSAFLYEMYNHEYAINLQADWDVLSVFGTVSYEDSQSDINKCFDALGFTKTQRMAYMDARAEYYKNQEVA